MTKRKRARVNIGKGANGETLYKWISGRTKKELADEKARVLQEVAAERVKEKPSELIVPTAKTCAKTFGEYAENWYRLYKKPNIRESTQEMYKNAFKAHLFPAFGNLPIDSITGDDLQEFIIEYEDSSKSLIDKLMLTLRQVFESAVDDDIIAKSPVRKMKPPEGIIGERLPLPLQDVGELTADALNHPGGLLPLLMLYTGMRRGEALALRWEDIEDGFINVRRAVVYIGNHKGRVGEPKTKAAFRKIPIVPVLANALQRGGSGFVFGGSKVYPYATFKRRWEALQRDIDALKGCTPHRLRHTFLMLLRRAGVDAATQQYLMGHSDYETTANDYTHIDSQDIAEARSKMAASLPSLLPKLLPKEIQA